MKVYEIREEHNVVLRKIKDDVFVNNNLYLNKEDAIKARDHLLWLREQTYKNHPTPNLLKTIYDAYPFRIVEMDVEIF